jgi:hypothetical protein
MFYSSGHIAGSSTYLLLQLSCSIDSDSTTGTVTMAVDDVAFYTYPSAVGAAPITPDPIVSNGVYSFASPGTQFVSIRNLRQYSRIYAIGNMQVTVPASTTCTVAFTFSNLAGNQPFYSQSFSASGTFPLSGQGQLEQESSRFSIQFSCTAASGQAGTGTLAITRFYLWIDA